MTPPVDSLTSLKDVSVSRELLLEGRGALMCVSCCLVLLAGLGAEGRDGVMVMEVFGPKDSLFLTESVREAPMLFCFRN